MTGHYVALCGGVGGAKLAFGLDRVLAPEDLTIVVNTGDDFEHLGLHISPDIDTVLYTLSGLADRERGWGLSGETWNFMSSLRRLGGETWFQLGDADLATHVERTRRLAQGETLSQATRALAASLGVASAIIPMSDDPVRTMIATDEGELSFQHYFVARQCAPKVSGIRFSGAADAGMAPDFVAALARPDLAGVIVCPSNPFLSIDPILSVPGVRAALAGCLAPVVAISPIVRGAAIKGPTAKLMHEFGVAPANAAIAEHYAGILDALIIDLDDGADTEILTTSGIDVHSCSIIMRGDEERIALAQEAIRTCTLLARGSAN